jgi:hypothetical protein
MDQIPAQRHPPLARRAFRRVAFLTAPTEDPDVRDSRIRHVRPAATHLDEATAALDARSE